MFARIRMIFWYAVGWGYLGLSTPLFIRARYLCRHGKKQKLYDLADAVIRRFARTQLAITGSKLTMEGLENIPKDTTVLFVSNHLGHMDSLIIQGYIDKPKGYLTISTYGDTPILGKWMGYMDCVFMDKQDLRQSLGCILSATETLRSGRSMVVFPEGKLNDGKTLEYEKGWLRLATKSGVPIVPITLRDTHRIISYDGKRMYPAHVHCIVSEPIATNSISRGEEREFVQQVKDVILSNM